MTPFPGPIKSSTEDGLNHILIDYFVWTRRDGRLFRGVIGATTDGPSIPQAMQSLIRATGNDRYRAGCAHDFSFRKFTQKFNATIGQWEDYVFTEDEADDQFKEHLEDCGMPAAEAEGFYLAVKSAFGHKAFQDDRKIEHNPT